MSDFSVSLQEKPSVPLSFKPISTAACTARAFLLEIETKGFAGDFATVHRVRGDTQFNFKEDLVAILRALKSIESVDNHVYWF
jgi:hypothetical protein